MKQTQNSLFQFHKGTIKTLLRCYFNFSKEYFNSIKVRLKQEKLNGVLIGGGFQFHKGTIKTKVPPYCYNKPYIFQFHKGTIKTMITPSMYAMTILISIP